MSIYELRLFIFPAHVCEIVVYAICPEICSKQNFILSLLDTSGAMRICRLAARVPFRTSVASDSIGVVR